MTNKDFALMLLYVWILAGITYFAHSNDVLRAWADKQTQVATEQIKTFERAYNDVPVDDEKAKEWLLENVPEPIELNPNTRKYEESGESGDDRAKQILNDYGLGYTFDYWKSQGDKHGIVYSLPLCIGIAESGLGSNLTTKNNIGNVWNTDGGKRKDMENVEQGIRAIFQTIDGTYLGNYSKIGELSGQGRIGLGLEPCTKNGVFCYASDTKHWNDNVSKCMSKIWGREIGASFNYKY